MSVVGKILATVADRYGTSVVLLARRPELYERPLYRAGIELGDITETAIARGAAYEREWDARIFERIRIYNEKISERSQTVGDNCNSGEKIHFNSGSTKVKVKRSAVIELFLAMDFGSAPKWDDAKLAAKIKELPALAADEPPPADKEHQRLLAKLLKAAKAGEKVEYETETTAGSPSGSPSGSPASGSPSGSPASSSDPSGSPVDPSDSPSGSPASGSSSGSPSGSPSASPAPAPAKAEKKTAAAPAEEFVGVTHLVAVLTRIALSLESVVAVLLKADAAQAGAPAQTAAPQQGNTKPAAADKPDDSLTAVNKLVFELMEAASSEKKGLKSADLLAKLQAAFPKRDKKWLDEKMRKQLGGVLESKYGLKVKKSRDGKYYTVAADK